MFRLPIVAFFREVFFDGYITYDVKTVYKCGVKHFIVQQMHKYIIRIYN